MPKERHVRKESNGSTLGLCVVPKESHDCTLVKWFTLKESHDCSFDMIQKRVISQATIKRRTRLERALNDGQVELAEDIYFSANGRQ